MKKDNRRKKQQKKDNRRMKRENRQYEGERLIKEDRMYDHQDYNLGWFIPTEAQLEIVESMVVNDLTMVDGSSGCGKSTTVIWQALKEMKEGRYKQILFVKTPVECTDDKIGFLSGDADDKLEKHFYATKNIFQQFMTKGKLDMEIKKERIRLDIPNFILGSTFDNTLLILDEWQQVSPKITKLVTERVGKNSKIVMMGDSLQRYANDKRDDGFAHFINMTTKVDENNVRYSHDSDMGYIRLSANENQRSNLSRKIVNYYEREHYE